MTSPCAALGALSLAAVALALGPEILSTPDRAPLPETLLHLARAAAVALLLSASVRVIAGRVTVAVTLAQRSALHRSRWIAVQAAVALAIVALLEYASTSLGVSLPGLPPLAAAGTLLAASAALSCLSPACR